MAVKDITCMIQTSAEAATTRTKPFIKKFRWWNAKLENLNREIKKLKRKFHKHRLPGDKIALAKARCTYKQELHKARRVDFQKYCEKQDKPWKLYKLLGKKRQASEHITLSDQDGNPICLDPNLNAKTLLDGFFPDDNQNEEETYHKAICSNVKSFLNRHFRRSLTKRISRNELMAAFSSMAPFKSPGHDKIVAALVEWVLDKVASPLANLFQFCLILSYFLIT